MKAAAEFKPQKSDGLGRRHGRNRIPLELWLVFGTEAMCFAVVAWKSLHPS